jgi:pilus assembly protein FimV
MRGNKLFRRAAVIAAISLLPSLAWAAGLGKINVMSALGQPLLAEIDLVAVSAEEMPSLAAKLASQDAYREANVEYPNGLGNFRFVVEKRPNGQPYLKVVTNQPINEPFLDLLIELNWASGRLLREYPILLDPPGYDVAKSQTPTVTAPQIATTPAPRSKRDPARTAAPTLKAPVATEAAPAAEKPGGAASEPAGSANESADTYGPVKSGETLRGIAESTRPPEVTLEQMLVSLYRENKGAFIGQNMNRMKTGMILKVPGATTLTEVNPAAAKREVVAQTADWNAYRKRLANVAARGAAQGDKPGQTAGGAIDTKVNDDKAPPEGGKDVLKLSKGQATTDKPGAAGKAVGEKLSALQEDVATRDRALEDARGRITALENQISEMRRLLELKGSPVPGEKPAMPSVETAPTSDKPTAVVTPPVEPKPAIETKPIMPPEAPSEPAATQSATPVEAPPVVKKPKRVLPPPAPVEEAGFLDGLMDNPLIPAAGAALLGLLGFLGYRQFRKRKDAQLGAFTATGAIPGGFKIGQAGSAGASAPLPEAENSSFLSDFDKVGAGNIDTDEVDPVAEADVYIAYGRDAQAEEILKEAMLKDPSRYEIPLKLLEIYANRKSTQSFESVANQLHATIGTQHPMWAKVAEMGRKIDAGNALYAAANINPGNDFSGDSTVVRAAGALAIPKATDDVPAAMRDTLTVKEPILANAPLDLDLDFDAASTEAQSATAKNLSPDTGMLDLDLGSANDQAAGDMDLGTQQKSGPTGDPFVLDFDLDSPKPAAAEPAKTVAEAAPAMFDSGGLDFQLDIDEPPLSATPVPIAPSRAVDLPALDISGIDLDLDSAKVNAATANDGAGWQSAETKLDLARAYLEIGDKIGAVEILQEVISEGSPEQQEVAKKLAAQA